MLQKSLLTLTVLLTYFVTVQSQTILPVIGKVESGIMFPTGDLNDTKLQPGYRIDLGVDIYVFEKLFVGADVFFGHMRSDKSAVVEEYEKMNRVLSEDDISNHIMLGASANFGYDLTLTQSLKLAPNASLYYMYIVPSRVSEFIQNDQFGNPVFRESTLDFEISGGYGFRPGVDLKWDISERVGVSVGAMADLYFYVETGFVDIDYYDNSLNDDEIEIDPSVNSNTIISVNAGLYFKL